MPRKSDIHKAVDRYCREVTRGKVPAGRLVRLAVRRHIDDLKTAAARGYHFVPAIAEQAIDFFTFLRHSKGEWAGQPVKLEPWQQFCLWAIFGWRRKADGLRRYKKAYISVGRKNGKSTLCAGLALLLLVADEPLEHGAEVYVAATKEQQAGIIHGEAVRMVRQSPDLTELIHHFKHTNTLLCEQLNAWFRPVGSDSPTLDGLNPHGVFFDELHAWRPHQRDTHEKLTTGGASRRQPLQMTITTAGDDRSQLWIEENDFAVRVLESVLTGDIVSDTTFAFIAQIDKEDIETVNAWLDGDSAKPLPATILGKANPNIGVSVKPEYLHEQAIDARAKPAARNSFLRYHCNVQTTSHERAIPPELWSSTIHDQPAGKGEYCHAGIDLGRADDFAAVTLCFPVGEEYHIRSWSWTCEDRREELKTAQVSQWIADGWLIEHEGDQIDLPEIQDAILKLSKEYDVRTWAFDPTFAKQMSQVLSNEHGLPMFEFTQAAKFYNEPIRRLLSELKAGTVKHEDDPCLAWQASNLLIRRNSKDEWMPDKGASESKIDAMVALLMAFSECLYAEKSSGGPLMVVV